MSDLKKSRLSAAFTECWISVLHVEYAYTPIHEDKSHVCVCMDINILDVYVHMCVLHLHMNYLYIYDIHIYHIYTIGTILQATRILSSF